MNWIQVQMKAQPGDEAFIENVFDSASNRFGMVDTKVLSLAENTICNYSEGLGFGFAISACKVEDCILVDFNPGKVRTERFNTVFEFISSQLQERLGSRMKLADTENFITVRNTLPVSDAHRAFANEMMKSVMARKGRNH